MEKECGVAGIMTERMGEGKLLQLESLAKLDGCTWKSWSGINFSEVTSQ